MLPSTGETPTVKLLAALLLVLFLLIAAIPAAAADHGSIVREAIIYISPDSSAAKLAQVERGRELVLLDRSRN